MAYEVKFLCIYLLLRQTAARHAVIQTVIYTATQK